MEKSTTAAVVIAVVSFLALICHLAKQPVQPYERDKYRDDLFV